MATNEENTKNQLPALTDVIREDLINTAVNFLMNANVQKSPVSLKEAFLRKKGLTEREIAVAFERSIIVSVPPPVQQPYQGLPSHTAVPIPLPQGYLLPPQSGWSRFRDIINTVAIVGGVVYGLYILYKRYIAPYLFGKKRSPLEESIASLDTSLKGSVEALRADLHKVQTDVEKLSEQQYLTRQHATAKQVLDIKSEIASLKCLLLNRKQFPGMADPIPLRKNLSSEQPLLREPLTNETSLRINSPPIEISSIGIPAWQLEENVKADKTQGEDLNEPNLIPVNGNPVVINGNAVVTNGNAITNGNDTGVEDV